MKTELVPAILVHNYRDLAIRLKAVEPYVKTVHLDVMDGKFVNNSTFSDASRVSPLLTKVRMAVHMMVERPSDRITEWAKAGAFRYVFHVESVAGGPELKDVVRQVKAAGLEAGVAINPETKVTGLKSVINDLDTVLVMAVKPGWGGQAFQKKALAKIKRLKKMNPKLLVGVDGGVSLDNAADILKAGADYLVVGSAIYASGSPKEAISRFKKIMAGGR